MAFVKKTWKDRIAEFPTRRRLTKEDNTSELVTVAREEGTLSQEGDAFSAENMNDLENRIDAEFTEVNGKLAKSVDFNFTSDPTCASTKNTMIAYADITEDGLYLIVGGSQVAQSLNAIYFLTIGLADSSGELISSPYMLVRNISMGGGGGGSLSSIISLKKGARVGMFLYNAHSSSVTAQYIRFAAVKL